MSDWNSVSNEIVELVRENLSTPDQMIPYAERLFSALLTEIKEQFSNNIKLVNGDNGVDIISAYNPRNKISLYYFPDFYFDEGMIILEYSFLTDGDTILSENLPVSEGVETFNKFLQNLMQDIDDIINEDKRAPGSELENQFLYLNNYLPDNLRTDDPYKLIEVIRVLLDGSNRIRKVTEK